MGTFSERVRESFDRRTARIVKVPEWGVDLHVFPVTLKQIAEISKTDDAIIRAASILRVRAKKQDGSPFFNDEDIDSLLMYGVGDFGPSVLLRVVGEINADTPSAEDAEKN